MTRKERYPERFKPFYVPGVGWTWDTRYVEKAKGGCSTIVVAIIAIWLILAIISGASEMFGVIVNAVV